jgi:hypothetical protein
LPPGRRVTDMNLHTTPPACHTTDWPVSARAPGFWDQGMACGTASTPKVWDIALQHTPGCIRCTRALRGLLLYRGPGWWARSAARRAGFSWPLPFATMDINNRQDGADDDCPAG